MKLYFAPGACSLSPHIVLRELGLPFDLIKVNLGEHKTQDGEDFKSINPKGYVPALKTDDGKVLTEGVAINQYLADKKPEKKLAPANGTFERYELQEWLNFISTEVHKTYSPMFNSALPEAARAHLHGQAEEAFRRNQHGAREAGFPHRLELHDRRCVSLHLAALGAEVPDRSENVAGAGEVLRSRRSAAGGEGGC